MHPAFRLDLPRQKTSCVVAASPHSGRHYGAAFMAASVLDALAIRSSEDAFVDQLVAAAPGLGAPLLSAEWPRAYLDLNRSADELDPAVIAGVGRAVQTPRINSGLGVVPRVVANGRAIYGGKMTLAEAQARISQVWEPYHTELARLMAEARAEFGQAVLLDFHSMPHEALDQVARPGTPRPQVVLGDRFGASAGSDVVDVLEQGLLDAGLVVSRNSPFAGAYITQRYGRPSQGMHAVQVEIDRALYMDERAVRPSAEFDAVQKLMEQVLARVINALPGRVALAAE